jgi:hypothetical protein
MRGAGRGKGSSIGGGIVQWLLQKKKDTISERVEGGKKQ